MPVIRVEVPTGTSADTQRTIRTEVKAAVLRTLAPKETRYDYVAVREVLGEIGDGVPLVEVDLRPGREPERKKALVDAIRGDPERHDGCRRRRRLCPVQGEPGGESLLRRHPARSLGAGGQVALGETLWAGNGATAESVRSSLSPSSAGRRGAAHGEDRQLSRSEWWLRVGSNHRPHDYESCALTG